MEFVIALVVIAVVIVIRVGLYFIDKDRIEAAAQQKGWRNVEVKWAPFAPGWFFEKGERHYRVTYLDEQGVSQRVYCKTSLFTGVFWREEGG